MVPGLRGYDLTHRSPPGDQVATKNKPWIPKWNQGFLLPSDRQRVILFVKFYGLAEAKTVAL